MVKNNFIVNYIRKMNNEQAKIFALKFGVIFSNEEINVLLPYLKENAPILLISNNLDKKIHTDLYYIINVNSINKLILLFRKLGY